MKKIKFVFYGVSKVWQTVLELRLQSGKSKILSVESTIGRKFKILEVEPVEPFLFHPFELVDDSTIKQRLIFALFCSTVALKQVAVGSVLWPS
jgi:hypothetical protein